MKIILLSAALMLVALGSNAQGLTPSPSPKGRVASAGRLTIEPRVGMTLSSFTGGGSGGATGKFGFTGCVDVEYGVSQLWSVSAGVGYVQFGASDYSEVPIIGYMTNYSLQKGYQLYVAEKNSMKYTLDYLTVPIMMGFHPYKGLTLRAGVQIGACVRTHAKGCMYVAAIATPNDEYGQATKDSSGDMPMTGLYGFDYDGDFDTGVNKLDVGIPVGLSYEFGHVVLDVRYVFGLLNMNKVDLEGHLRNSAFSATVGYKFKVTR